jgi:phosphate-selective porin OprO and OprP
MAGGAPTSAWVEYSASAGIGAPLAVNAFDRVATTMPYPQAPLLLRPATYALILALCLIPSPAWSQSVESEHAPARGEFEPAPLPEVAFALPDVPRAVTERTAVRSKWFTMKVGFVVIADYTAFRQDTTSVTQVGEQRDQWDDRAARLMLRGTLGKANYLIAGEYKGFESDPETTWQMTDVSVTVPLGGPQTRLTLGKTKETFAYEMVGDAANLPPQERVLSPFFVSRNIGAKLSRVIGKDHRMTAAVGVFNDWWVTDDTLSDSGTTFTARVTGLAWDTGDGSHFLHLGLAGRYAGADNDTLRFKGRPESNVADNFVDTGNLDGDHSQNAGVEVLLNEGPFSVLAEYHRAWVDAPTVGDPTFQGYYIVGSWVLTGETRRYDRTVGYARRVMPTRRWGAPELVVRFSHADLDDGVVRGGTFDKTYVGLNWWATRRWKFGVGWGHTWLDRFATSGKTDSVHTRFQWVY